MSLYPKISGNFNEVTKTIEIFDVTGIYDSTTNPFGWETPNLSKAAITSAFINLRKHGKDVVAFDVTSVVQSSDPAVAEYKLTDIDLSQEKSIDGTYVFDLVINDSAYRAKPIAVFITLDVKKIASQYWSELAIDHDVYTRREKERECHWLEMSILGLGALSRRGYEQRFLNQLSFIQRRIENNKNLFKI